MADIASLNFSINTSDLTKAQRELNSFGESAKRATSAVGMVATAVGAVGGVIAASIIPLANMVREHEFLAEAVGVSRGALQSWGFAAETVGINTEQLADIFKDVNEKIGEAAATAGGEGAEALELLGLQAEKLNALTPDKQLEAVANALENVGSKGEKIFILESLANDASRLLPLLEDGATALNQLQQEALAVGAVTSDQDAQDLTNLANSWSRFGGAVEGFAVSMAADLAPAMSDALDGMVEGLATARNFWNQDFVPTVQKGAVAIAASIDKASNIMEFYWESALSYMSTLWDQKWGIMRGVLADGVQAMRDGLGWLFDAQFPSIDGLIDTIRGASPTLAAHNALVADLKAELRDTNDAIDEAATATFLKIDADTEAASVVSTLTDNIGSNTRALGGNEGAIDDVAMSYRELKGILDDSQRAYNNYYDITQDIIESAATEEEKVELVRLAYQRLQDEIKGTNDERERSGKIDTGISTGAISGGITGDILGAFQRETSTVQERVFGRVGTRIGEVMGDKVGEEIGKSVTGTLGEVLGGIAGPVGGFLGGAFGSLIGGLFGPGESNKTQAFNFEALTGVGTQTGFTGEKFSQANRDAADLIGAYLQTLNVALQDETESAVNANLGIVVGSRDGIQAVIDGTVAYTSENLDDVQRFLERHLVALFGMEQSTTEFYTWMADKAGEALGVTMTRLNAQYNAIAPTFERMNLSLGTTQQVALHTADELVTLSGGIDGLSSSVSAYYAAFFTAEERAEHQTNALIASVEELGYELPEARQGFRDLVESLDLTTESGRNAFTVLTDAANAADAYYTAIEEGAKKIPPPDADPATDSTATGGFMDWVNKTVGTGFSYDNRVAPTNTAIEETIREVDELGLAMDALRLAVGAVSDHISDQRDATVEQARTMIDLENEQYNERLTLLKASHSAALEKENDNLQSVKDYHAQNISLTQDMLSNLRQQYGAYTDDLKGQIDTLNDSLRDMTGISDMLANAMDGARIQSDALTLSRRQQGIAALERMAISGVTDPAELERALGATGGAAQQFFGSFEEYARSQARVTGAIGQIKTPIDEQIDLAQQQVSALEQQLVDASEAYEQQYGVLTEQLDAQREAADSANKYGKAQIDLLKENYAGQLAVMKQQHTDAINAQYDVIDQANLAYDMQQETLGNLLDKQQEQVDIANGTYQAILTVPAALANLGTMLSSAVSSAAAMAVASTPVAPSAPVMSTTSPVRSSQTTTIRSGLITPVAPVAAERSDAIMTSIAKSSAATARTLQRWNGDGLPTDRGF